MNKYTEKLEAGAAGLYEYDAIEKLPAIIASFHGHGAALSEFLTTRGISGESTEEQAKQLKACFEKAGIGRNKARYASGWLSGERGFDRVTGFRIAFALGLTIDETNEFFRTVLLDRGFDCHTISEAIYYFCIYSGRDYPTAERLIKAAPKPTGSVIRFDGDVLYTHNIVSFIRSCRSEAALLEYFQDNLPQFGYNHVKATEFIIGLWDHISAPDGLAERERRFLLYTDESLPSGRPDSASALCLQILGLDHEDVKHIEIDRTIKPILDNKRFIHEFTAENFPNRQILEKILRGEPTEHDAIRKMLILLTFYQYWLNTALSRSGNRSYAAGENDRDRCLAELDDYLLDAGFSELYPGNPYDWIFLWAAGREAPMIAFRSYWQLLSAEYSDRISQ